MSDNKGLNNQVDRIVYLTGFKRGVVIQKIASMNGVTRQTVYNWLKEDTFTNRALILYALEQIEKENPQKQEVKSDE